MILKKKILTSILFLLIGVVCIAQKEVPPPPPPPTQPGFPVGTNAVVVLAFGLFYGIKSLLAKKNKGF